MKNIHVLPTENYKQDYTTMRGEVIEVVRLGQLIRHKEVGEFLVNKNPQWAASCDTDILVPHHMYITSDEELKDGDWFLDIISNTIHRAKQATGFFNTRKKIILTTDQDLIKYGVQTIDDELLDACISVISHSNEKATKDSKLIIPKKEHKPLKTMKNIHVIPTDKPSRFFNTNEGKYHFREHYVPDTIQTCKNHNIYITSDEEIKEGDWVITPTNDILEWAKVFQPIGKKIILTTHQKLIKYGVQPIDDEFLKWFVENESCETVEIDRDEREVGNHLGGVVTEYGDYKIIIPQEEINMFTKGKKYIQQDGVVILAGENGTNGIVITDHKKMWGVGHYSDEWNPKAFKLLEEPKQETLEEAAKRLIKLNRRDAFYEDAKWQAERMYSEEEVIDLLIKMNSWPTTFEGKEDITEWFEQSKNKNNGN